MTSPTHYEVLGVAPDADRETIRRAYVEIARATHPDRTSTDHDARADASRTIRAANAAWNVLGDERRRAEYDRRLRGIEAPPPVGRTAVARTRVVTGRPSSPAEPPVTGTSAWAWIAVAAVLLAFVGVLVVSAYATSKDAGESASTSTSTTRQNLAVGSCVDVSASPSGRVATVVPCASARTGRILAIVDTPRPCPLGTAVELGDARTTLCLEPV